MSGSAPSSRPSQRPSSKPRAVRCSGFLRVNVIQSGREANHAPRPLCRQLGRAAPLRVYGCCIRRLSETVLARKDSY